MTSLDFCQGTKQYRAANGMIFTIHKRKTLSDNKTYYIGSTLVDHSTMWVIFDENANAIQPKNNAYNLLKALIPKDDGSER